MLKKLLLLCILGSAGKCFAIEARELMKDVYSRHKQYPYVYEEQSMVLSDKHGLRTTRRAKLFTRVDDERVIHFLLVFIAPEEIAGVAILAHRPENGEAEQFVYIPALGNRLTRSLPKKASGNFLGTDFSIESVIGEDLDSYNYTLQSTVSKEGFDYFVVEAFEADTDKLHHRHYIRTDNHFICKTEYIDEHGRISKILSLHDIHRLHEGMWRSNMMLMQDVRQVHESLIKIDHRVFSEDYVPMDVFTGAWLFENFPYIPDIDQQPQEEVPVEERLESLFVTDVTSDIPMQP